MPAVPSNINQLFSPVQLGELHLRNRFVMSAMTRNRGVVPGPAAVEYYRQRARQTGMLLSEGVLIELQGTEWPYAPGLWNAQQVAGWKKVTDVVHAEGSLIVAQLWHFGRKVHPLHQGGRAAYGPSAIAARGGKYRLLTGEPGYIIPEAIEEPEDYVALHKAAAVAAKAAGFDGVELHAGNGWLNHQFLDLTSNLRTDKWGGSVENRCRFTLRAIDELVAVWGAGRVGIKLTPCGGYNDMGFDKDDTVATFGYLAEQLSQRGVAFIEWSRYWPLSDPTARGTKDLDPIKEIALRFVGATIGNVGYDAQSGADAIEQGDAAAISYGNFYWSNPDLPYRFKHGIELTPPDWTTIYTHPEGKPEVGYTTYRFASQESEAGPVV